MVIDFADGSTWIIPEGWTMVSIDEKPGHCRSCHAHVLWLTSQKSEKRAPFNHDGVNHFVTCPQSREWRKK